MLDVVLSPVIEGDGRAFCGVVADGAGLWNISASVGSENKSSGVVSL